MVMHRYIPTPVWLFAAALGLRVLAAAPTDPEVERIRQDALKEICELITPEETARKIGVRWPPPKTEMTREEADDAVDAALRERVESETGSLSEEAVRAAAEAENPLLKEGDAIAFDKVRGGIGGHVSGRIIGIYPARVRIGSHWVTPEDIPEDIRMRLYRDQYKAGVAKTVAETLQKRRAKARNLERKIRDDFTRAKMTDLGFTYYDGDWQTGDELAKIVNYRTALARKEGFEPLLTEKYKQHGYVMYKGSWTSEAAVAEDRLRIRQAMEQRVETERRRLAVASERLGTPETGEITEQALREAMAAAGGGQSPVEGMRAALVVVESVMPDGSKTTAPGFTAKMGDFVYMLTNQHLIGSGREVTYRNLQGDKLCVTELECHPTLNLARLRLEDASAALVQPLPLSVLDPVPDLPVFVLESEATEQGVACRPARVLGVEPDSLDTDAEIAARNSGSPILNLAGCVIGVAGHQILESEEWTVEGTRFRDIRRFACRLGDLSEFGGVSTEDFRRQSLLLNDASTFLLDLAAILVQNVAFIEGYDPEKQKARYYDEAWPQRIGTLIRERGILRVVQESRRQTRLGADERTEIPQILVAEVRFMQKRLATEAFVSGYLRERADTTNRAGNMLIKIGPILDALP